ncbi:hypothetical protein C8035_v002870 [Colletotrichum spinosum]|uniref:Uncharacterized protein n=1 Tax=Colletotrichum spinosum TaxID=1347390 RepID=A0A4R8PQV6_9PEZI|nr:hypothetical protein C8035_v002870 [Colletotrichum spinosum]
MILSLLIIILLLLLIIEIRIITIFNSYNFNISINLIIIINNYKNYNYFYKRLKELALYKSDFTTISNPFKIAKIIFCFDILLEDKAISEIKKKEFK